MIKDIKSSGKTKGCVLKDELSVEEIADVLRAADKLGEYQGVDLGKLVRFFLYTGAHPSVLSNKQKSSIKTTESGHLQWSRPKKKGGVSITRVKISKHLEPWIYEWILQEFPVFREWYWGACKVIGNKAKVPRLSPMSFRHTFGCMLDDMGLASSEVQRLMNCSFRTLMRYTRRDERRTDSKLEELDW